MQRGVEVLNILILLLFNRKERIPWEMEVKNGEQIRIEFSNKNISLVFLILKNITK
jgi:hypothetical protein